MAAKKSKAAGKKSSAPRWATQPFSELIDHTERLGQLLHLNMRGISMIRAVPKVIEALAQAERHDGGEGHQRIEDAEKEAELARREVSEEFPLLHAHTAIALWSALEAAVRLFMARWLQHHKPAMEVEVVQKLRVRICEYERLDGEDRFFYILDRLEQELSAPLKNGITKFESLLEPFGLAGPVDEDVRRDLLELSQVRNALVHRSGVADRRLVKACPWLQLKVGDWIHVRHEATERYFACVMKYSTALIVRMAEHFGVDMSKFRSEAQAAERSPPKAAKRSTAGGADPRHPAHPDSGSRRASR